MKQTDFIKGLEDTYADCIETSRRKNTDYAGISSEESDQDPFKNFRLFDFIFQGLDISKADRVALSIYIRILDKISRTATLLVQENQVTDEKLADTLKDLCNYSAILKTYLENKEPTVNYIINKQDGKDSV